MIHRRTWKRFGGLSALALLATLGCQSTGASQTAQRPDPRGALAERFDLVIHGLDFDPGEHEVFLRTNLDFGAEWESVGLIEPERGAAGEWATVVLPGLSTERFFGQDYRENYLDLRIVTANQADGSQMAAVYAVPHTPGAGDAAERITALIVDDPIAVERVSIASHVQPRPAELRPGEEYIEHVLGPTKHIKPGVAEAEQLQVEFRNRP